MQNSLRTTIAARINCLALLTLVLLLGNASFVRSENCIPQTLPVGITKRPPAWSIVVDPSGIEGVAYRAVKVTVTSKTAVLTNDHTLRVVLSTNGYNEYAYDEQVTDYIQLPAGTTSATKFIDFPQRRELYQLHIAFYEDGDLIEGCSTTFGVSRGNARPQDDESTNVLVIDYDAPDRDTHRTLVGTLSMPNMPLRGAHLLPDIRSLVGAVPSNAVSIAGYSWPQPNDQFDDAQLIQLFTAHDGVDIVPPSDLSDRWLSQSNADLIVISLDDLKKLAATDKPRFDALADCVMAGATLLVHGGGENWEGCGELSTLLKMNSRTQGESNSPVPNWNFPSKSTNRDQVTGLSNLNQGQTVSTSTITYAEDGTVIAPTVARPRSTNSDPTPFVFRRYGLGIVAMTHHNNPFPGDKEEWICFWNTISASQFFGARRMGLSHERENNEYWNFLIPGVGSAPVFSFMGMIAIFMLLIGPVNYQVLKRQRRLSLMLVTVPLGATIFTSGLFLFAFVSDGFGTRVRVRSFTALEPGTKTAAAYSRQTYYMAFVPSSGMQYPLETAVFPLHAQPYEQSVQGNFYRSQSEWGDDKLMLKRRYLAAREHRQFVTLRATSCSARLDVQKTGEKTLNVKNSLGAAVEYGVICDEQGKLYEIESLAQDGSALVSVGDPAAIHVRFAKWLHADVPTLPQDFDPRGYDNIFSVRRRYYYGGYNQSLLATQSMSVLERNLREADATVTTLANGGSPQQGSVRFYYLLTTTPVIADDGQSMAPLGVAGAQVVAATHLVRGSW